MADTIPGRRYGRWAGNAHGVPENVMRCVAQVWLARHIQEQCARRRGFGPSGDLCRQHAQLLMKGRFVDIPERDMGVRISTPADLAWQEQTHSKPRTVTALSVWGPWWWYLVHGYKPVENRTWDVGFRGTLYIHAAKRWDEDGMTWIRRHLPEMARLLPADVTRVRGGVVGCVELVSTHHRLTEQPTPAEAPWVTGPYFWRVTRPKPLPFFAVRGRQRLFRVEVPGGYDGDA